MNLKLTPWQIDKAHYKRIWNWRNAKATRAHSFRQSPLQIDDFIHEFEKKYCAVKNLGPFWIMTHQPVGWLFFEPWYKETVLQVSLFLNPQQQGKGLGPLALIEASKQALKQGYEELIAFVSPENTYSQKAFKKSHFINKGKLLIERNGQSFEMIKYSCELAKKSSKVFIIAEAGSNYKAGSYEEDLTRGYELIKVAYTAGADAIKFQLYDATSVYAKGSGTPGYLEQDIHEIFEQYALDKTLIPKLHQYASYLGIEWMCSTFSEPFFDYIDPWVQRHKIASYELKHLRLLEKAAHSNKPLILSTGACNETDIEWAMQTYYDAGGKEITLMHCNAQYPADPEALHLNCIQGMQKKFKVPVGFSDHSSNPTLAPCLATALGATVLEKHFTLSRKLKGPDHFFAIEPNELNEMIKVVRQSEAMLGLAKKSIFPQEEALAQFATRGLQALREIKKGEAFIEGENVGILRPGNRTLGLHPKYLPQLLQSRSLKNLSEGEGIQHNDVAWT